MSIFEVLNKVNVNEHTEKKNGLTYLSWAWAWAEVKKAFPDATYTIYENRDGWNYHTDGKTAWVKTGVTINGLEHIEYLPVMDYRNRSITVDKITSFDVNTAIQRSLTKAVARHGLGLYIYAGEDLPEGQEEPAPEDEVKAGTEYKAPEFNVKKAVNVWSVEHGINAAKFADLREVAIRTGLAPNIKSSEMTEEQFNKLADIIGGMIDE